MNDEQHTVRDTHHATYSASHTVTPAGLATGGHFSAESTDTSENSTTTDWKLKYDDKYHDALDPYTSQQRDTTWTDRFTNIITTAHESGSYADRLDGGRDQSGSFTSTQAIETGDNGEDRHYYLQLHADPGGHVENETKNEIVSSGGTTSRLAYSGSYGPAGGSETVERSRSEFEHLEEEQYNFVGVGNLSNDHTTHVRDYTANYPVSGRPSGSIDETKHKFNPAGTEILTYEATGDPLGDWTETFYDEETGAFWYSIPYHGDTALATRPQSPHAPALRRRRVSSRRSLVVSSTGPWNGAIGRSNFARPAVNGGPMIR